MSQWSMLENWNGMNEEPEKGLGRKVESGGWNLERSYYSEEIKENNRCQVPSLSLRTVRLYA